MPVTGRKEEDKEEVAEEECVQRVVWRDDAERSRKRTHAYVHGDIYTYIHRLILFRDRPIDHGDPPTLPHKAVARKVVATQR